MTVRWLIDRWWAFRHRDELREIEDAMAALDVRSARLEREMVAMYGPDWRAQAEARLRELT
jgi:hypothetical protein